MKILKAKIKKKLKKKRPQEPIMNNISSGAVSVVCMTTNPEIKDVPNIKMKRKKNIRKQKRIRIKIKN